jgi:hypothetical protein
MTSVISSLRRMLLNWPDAPANTRQVLESLLAELATPCRQLSRRPHSGAAGAAAGCRLPPHRLLGAVALFLPHLSGKQPLDPPG